MPGCCAVSSFCIFIASTIATAAPAGTTSPTSTLIATTSPGMGDATTSPVAFVLSRRTSRSVFTGKPGDCVSVEYGSAVGVDPPRLPTAFGLRLAGANPSREATAFAVDLPRDARYALDVFDSAGRLVRRFGGEGTAGTQVLRWDGASAGGASVPPGLYWARLEVAGERFVRKVMRL